MKALRAVLLACSVLLSLPGCGAYGAGVERTATVAVAPTAGFSTQTFPPAVPAALPTAALQPMVAPATALPKPSTPQEMMLQVFLIAVGDNGVSGKKVGCGDSVVPVQVEVPYTVGVLRASLNALFSIKQRNYGESGLYNSLYQSSLKVQDVLLQNGTATVTLAGSLQLGGECDNPRVEAQIEETALQFSTVHQLKVFLNGKPLDQALSLK